MTCLNNEKQIGVSSAMYSGDYNDWLVSSYFNGGGFWQLLSAYISNANSWHCPEALLPNTVDHAYGYSDVNHKLLSYGGNIRTWGWAEIGMPLRKITFFTQPSATGCMLEATTTVLYGSEADTLIDRGAWRHGNHKTMNLLFLDGHIRNVGYPMARQTDIKWNQ